MTVHYVLDARTATSHFPGIGRYVYNLSRALGPLLKQHEHLVLLHDPTQPSTWDVAGLTGERVEVIEAPVSPFSMRQQWLIPRLLHRVQCDVYHSPYYLMPYWPGAPAVLTVHDLIPLLFPQAATLKARLLFQWTTAQALRTASHIVAISAATRGDVLNCFHTPASEISVIPLAADAWFHPQTPDQVARMRHQYGLPQDYVLYLGINKPHKNLARLIEAWDHVVRSWGKRPEVGATPQLVIAGAWDARYPECRERVDRLGLEDRVRFLGFVPDEDLPALYSGAMLFLFPSLYEGFGLPVLEAMSCAVPVLCSNTSSLPEIVGRAALTFDPLDVNEMGAKILQGLHDAGLRQEMREAGLRRRAQYSWEETGRRTLSVYRSVAHGEHPGPD